MILKLLAISRNTFLESVRQPILSVLILMAALALVLNPSVAAYTLDDDNKLLIDLGLSTLLLAGLLMAGLVALDSSRSDSLKVRPRRSAIPMSSSPPTPSWCRRARGASAI